MYLGWVDMKQKPYHMVEKSHHTSMQANQNQKH